MRPRRDESASFFLVMLATLVLPSTPRAAGANSGTEEVRLPSLAIGKTYSTWRMGAPPLVLRNPSDDTLRVHVEIIVPARHELTPGALPVPDRNWVQLENDGFVLPPHATARTDVRLTLPYDPDLAGHLYQVDLWSDASRTPRRNGTGQRHRLLFTVERDYRDDTEIDLSCLSRPPAR